MSNPRKTSWNALPAFAMLVSSAALAWNDLKYSGDVIFQVNPAPAMGWLLMFLMISFLMAHIVAIVPKRFLFPITLLFISRTSFGFPFNAVLSNNTACFLVSACIAVLSGIYFVTSFRKSVGERPWFKVKHTLAVLSVGIVLGVLYFPLGLCGMVFGFQNTMGDYVRISPKAVSLVERVFSRNGKKVYLIGMMHIGEGDFYAAIDQRMTGSQTGTKRVVLTEGVSDKKGVLPKHFASGKMYSELAKRFGLKVQDSGRRVLTEEEREARDRQWAEKGIHFTNADIDVSELSPEHLKNLTSILETIGSGNLAKLLMGPEDMENHELEDLFMDGLIKFRNDRLMQHFNRVIEQDVDEVFIPWGAAHLPDIEERLIKQGYEKINEEKRPVIRFWNRKKNAA